MCLLCAARFYFSQIVSAMQLSLGLQELRTGSSEVLYNNRTCVQLPRATRCLLIYCMCCPAAVPRLPGAAGGGRLGPAVREGGHHPAPLPVLLRPHREPGNLGRRRRLAAGTCLNHAALCVLSWVL